MAQNGKQSGQTPDYDYKDIHGPSLEDIFNEEADIEDAASTGDTIPLDKQAAPQKTEGALTDPDTTKPIVEAEAPSATTPKEDAKPAIDEEALSDKLVSKLVDKLSPQDATKEEKKDLKAQIQELEKAAADKGETLTYADALEFLANKTTEEVSAKLEESVTEKVMKKLADEVEQEETETKKQQEEATKVQAERTTYYNTKWDRELSQLESTGKIPKIIDAKDPKDAGRIARANLFEVMKRVSDEQMAKGIEPSFNLVETFALHYQPAGAKPAGANAPVAGARRSVAPSNTDEYSYQDIHNNDIYDILAGK